MGREIERKFLVEKARWRPQGHGFSVRQGYLPQAGELLVRIRTQDGRAFLTLKGRTTGITRAEFEYESPAGATMRKWRAISGRLTAFPERTTA